MLQIPRALCEEVIAHCRSTSPKEACGVLAGDAAEALGERLRVVQVYPMTNVEDSPISYALDPKEQLAVEKLMRQRTQRMAAIYHSHTATEAYPSPVDVARASEPGVELLMPGVSYVLVSLKDQRQPDIKSYRIEGERVTPDAVQVV